MQALFSFLDRNGNLALCVKKVKVFLEEELLLVRTG